MLTFEDKIKDIDRLLEIKRSKWMLTNVLAFDDLSQIIRLHIHKKFFQWKQELPFDPWCATIIVNQINNQIRNHYGRFTPPCVKDKGCPFNTGDGCQWTQSGKKDASCPAYAKWEISKKNAYELKFAAPLEDFDGATHELDFDIDKSISKFHTKIKEKLTARMYEAYKYLYIDHLSDYDTAIKLGFKTKEKNRCPGYRQISNMKAEILKIAQNLVKELDLEY